MKIRLKFQAPSLSELLSGDHSEEEIEEVRKLCQMFFHDGNPHFLKVVFDTKKEEAEVVLPKKKE